MKRSLVICATLLMTALLACEDDLDCCDPLPPVCSWELPRDWCMHFSTSVGYQRDRQRFAEVNSNDTTVQKGYLTGCDFVVSSLKLLFTWERLRLGLLGTYGWEVRGHSQIKILDPFSSGALLSFPSFSTGSGYTADVQPFLGCRIPFWTSCSGSTVFSFTPALGYNYSHFNIYPERTQTATPANGFASLCFSAPIQQDWFGPYAEGRLAWEWCERWVWEVFYQYYHLSFRETMWETLDRTAFSGGVLSFAQTSQIHLSLRGHTFRTQRGGADFSYRSSQDCPWKLGVHFEGGATWSNTGHGISRIKTREFTPINAQSQTIALEKWSLHWTRYLATFYASYRF